MIPFSKTTLGKEETEAVKKVIDSGWVVQGKITDEFERKFAEYVGSKYAVFVDSGTSALFLSLSSLELEGEPVRVPSFTFTATAEVVKNTGNEIFFYDVNKDTMCIDKSYNIPTIAVHLGGRKAKAPALIYDSAHRIEKDDVIDSNALWCYSFYATKNMTTIQGGMIALNNKDTYEWLKRARDHGLNLTTEQRYKGKYAQYDIDFIGWRMKGDDLRAAVGLEQLKKLPINTMLRNKVVDKYNRGLGYNRKGNHLYIVTVNDQQKFMDYMLDNGIQCAINYRPLHTMTGYKEYSKSLPNTEWLGNHVVSLPLFPQLTNSEVEHIIKAAKESGMLIYE